MSVVWKSQICAGIISIGNLGVSNVNIVGRSINAGRNWHGEGAQCASLSLLFGKQIFAPWKIQLWKRHNDEQRKRTHTPIYGAANRTRKPVILVFWKCSAETWKSLVCSQEKISFWNVLLGKYKYMYKKLDRNGKKKLLRGCVPPLPLFKKRTCTYILLYIRARTHARKHSLWAVAHTHTHKH